MPFAIAQSKVEVYYTLFDSLPQDMAGIVGTNRLKDDFDMTTTHFVIVDDAIPNSRLTELTSELGQVDGVNQVLSYESFWAAASPSFVPEEIREIFQAGGHRMLLANSGYKRAARRRRTPSWTG